MELQVRFKIQGVLFCLFNGSQLENFTVMINGQGLNYEF